MTENYCRSLTTALLQYRQNICRNCKFNPKCLRWIRFLALKFFVHGWRSATSIKKNESSYILFFYERVSLSRLWVSAPSLLFTVMLCFLLKLIIVFCRVKDALGYVQYILKSIRTKPLFKNVALEPRSCWEYLMWMDPVCTRVVPRSMRVFVSYQCPSLLTSFSSCFVLFSLCGFFFNEFSLHSFHSFV